MKNPSKTIQGIMGAIIPKNILEIWFNKAKAYVDSKLSGSDSLASEFAALKAKVKVIESTYTQKEGSKGIIAEAGQDISVDDANADVMITGTVDTKTTLTAKSVNVDNTTFVPEYSKSADGISVVSPTVNVVDSTMTGATQESSNLFRVKEAETLTIDGTTFTGDTYNTVMTGQKTKVYLKEFNLLNCKFEEACKHFNVWFAGYQDGAVLNIKNCSFKTCEQFLCVADFSGTENHLTVNIEDVTIENYDDTGDIYNGFILMDDRVCTSMDDFIAKSPFSKVTFNIKNLTVKGQKVTAESFKMGSADKGQMLYMYVAKADKTVAMSDDTAALFPAVNFVD